MMSLSIVRPVVILTLVVATLGFSADAAAEPFTQGAKSCQECHKDQYKVWEESKHFKSFRTVHRTKEAKAIIATLGGTRRMKKKEDCTLCHYTMKQKSASAKGNAKSGPSCESCHGPSSEWEKIHGDYGGKNVKKEDETPEHKAKRIADSKAAGLIWSSIKYDVVANCLKCHGLARSEINAVMLARMMGAGHPLNPDFEVVSYSQGKMKHWPDRSPAELAYLFVAGQAAKLVSGTEAVGKTEDVQYKNAQMKRAADAKAVLRALIEIPEAATLIGSPNEENARKLVAAIADKDLWGKVKGMVPDKGSYK